MVDDPVDLHFRMVDEHSSIKRMESAIWCLQDARVDFVVEGGWAIAAFGSKVPSVDLDVLVPGGLTEEIAAAIEESTGYQMFSQETHDVLALDFVDSMHPNPLIDRPLLSYVPAELLKGQTEIRTIPVEGGIEVTVPNATILGFMKTKAFHDRLLQWKAASGERWLLGGMSEENRIQTIKMGESHWLRKAGKDLFDISFLCRDDTTMDMIAASAPDRIWTKAASALKEIPLPVRTFATTMAKRAGSGDVPLVGGVPGSE